jgi:fructan beta-fructosidase
MLFATVPLMTLLGAETEPYSEALRPQFHFSARQNWINDPNGLVFQAGEYHLFFQHNPLGREWGNMTWGHAVSPDLLTWRQLDHALYPDKFGTMFSGSAVVDRANTSGFKTGDEPPLVAIYTAAGDTSPESKGLPFSQCIAFSNDRGRTWTKYPGNPVLKAVGKGDRDPKVFWHAPTRRWVMPLYVGEPDASRPPGSLGEKGIRPRIHFFTSPDLKEWVFTSKFEQDVYECPGFAEIRFADEPTRSRWVLWGANGRYWTGGFDGASFHVEDGPHAMDFGPNFYAAQAYDDLPDRRIVLIGWMQGGQFPGMPFNGQMGIPTELSLRSTPDGTRLARRPVRELAALRKTPALLDVKNRDLTAADTLTLDAVDTLDLELHIKPAAEGVVEAMLRGTPVRWEAGSLKVGDRSAPVPLHNGELRLRVLLDRSSLEVFAAEGTVGFTRSLTPDPADRRVTLTAPGARIRELRAHALTSVWR